MQGNALQCNGFMQLESGFWAWLMCQPVWTVALKMAETSLYAMKPTAVSLAPSLLE